VGLLLWLVNWCDVVVQMPIYHLCCDAAVNEFTVNVSCRATVSDATQSRGGLQYCWTYCKIWVFSY